MMTNDSPFNHSEYNARLHSYASTTDAKDIRQRRSIYINAKERPASAIFFANANHPLPEVEQIDEWFESLTQYEDILEDMAKVSLDPVFRDELNAIDQWFSVLSEAEKTAALYNLLQHASDVQVRFFITILQQMAKMDPALAPVKEFDEINSPNSISPGFRSDNVSNFKNKDINTQQGFNYSSSHKSNQFGLGGLENNFKNLSTDKSEVYYSNNCNFAGAQRSAFSSNGWELDSLPQEEKTSFGAPNKPGSLRDSGVYNDAIDPKLLNYSSLSTSNSVNWRQKSISNTSMALSEAISNRRSIYLERPSSIVDVDSSLDWKAKVPTIGNQDQISGNVIGTGSYQLSSSGINGPSLGNLVSSALGSSPNNSKLYMAGPRQSFEEKDRNSVRWSTLSESLEPFIPMHQEHSSKNILDHKPNNDRRSISNRLSIVLNSARDLGSAARQVQNDKYYANIATSPLGNSQTAKSPKYSTGSYTAQQAQNKFNSSNAFPQAQQPTTGRSYGVIPKTTTNSFKVDQDDRRGLSSAAISSPITSSSLYSNSRNSKEFSNVNHDRATDLIKQKAAALRNGMKSSQEQALTQAQPQQQPQQQSHHQTQYQTQRYKAELNDRPISSGTTPSDPSKSTDKSVTPVNFELLKDIPSWMKSLRLHKYTPCFEGMDYHSIIELDDEALTNIGVHALGARRKMLKVFEQIKIELGH